MPRFTPRFVVHHPEKGYYHEHKVIETKAVTLKGQVMGYEQLHAPKFDGRQQIHGAQFNTREDAQTMIDNKDELYGPAGCFDGCVVEENTQEQE